MVTHGHLCPCLDKNIVIRVVSIKACGSKYFFQQYYDQ